MNANKFVLPIAIVVFGVLGLVLIKFDEKTPEGQLMVKACKDISAHSPRDVIDDMDLISDVIASHIANSILSDSLARDIIAELDILNSPKSIRKSDNKVYQDGFTHILNELAYMEIEKASILVEEGMNDSAMISILEATHYMYDAFKLTGDSLRLNEAKLVNRLTKISKESINSTSLEIILMDFKKIL